MSRALRIIAVVLIAGSCGANRDLDTEVGNTIEDPPADSSGQEFPDVIHVDVTKNDDGTFKFDVTISSPYDSANRYADAWRVIDEAGAVYGIRELVHDHSAEQPFTRSLDKVEIPETVEEVTIEARDLVNGWGGSTVTVDLDG